VFLEEADQGVFPEMFADPSKTLAQFLARVGVVDIGSDGMGDPLFQ
jgi:hypothetical protein